MIYRKSLQGDARVGDAIISSVCTRAAGNRRRITGGILQGKNLSDNYSKTVALLLIMQITVRESYLDVLNFDEKDIKQPQTFISTLKFDK